MWDWWWFPFDFDTATPNARSRRGRTRSPPATANTPLKEYYWSTPAAIPQGRVRTGIHGARPPADLRAARGSRIYALANGELVAARFPAEGAMSLAFMLVRHEVFHQLDRARRPGGAGTLPVFADRIDYDMAPTSVYSLYMHSGGPPG